MADLSEKLDTCLKAIGSLDTRADRIQVLIETARRYSGVPEHIATPPYDRGRQVPGCESQVYFFTEPRSDRTLDYHFAIESPHGISAKALAVILKECLSGQPLDRVAAVSTDVVYHIFGRELSMGKSAGLRAMVSAVVETAASSSKD